MRLASSRHRFLDPFGGPKEAKIDQKSSSDDVKNEKSENPLARLLYRSLPPTGERVSRGPRTARSSLLQERTNALPLTTVLPQCPHGEIATRPYQLGTASQA